MTQTKKNLNQKEEDDEKKKKKEQKKCNMMTSTSLNHFPPFSLSPLSKSLICRDISSLRNLRANSAFFNNTESVSRGAFWTL